jgi:hypothetical protein
MMGSPLSQDLNKNITDVLSRLYYRPEGYYQSTKKFSKAIQHAGYNFPSRIVKEWLHNQAIFQIYRPPPKYIQRASFVKINRPNLVHQCDLVKLTYDEVDGKIYMWCLTIVDVASRFKEAYPLTSKNSSRGFRRL